ncbi:hypothetical protein ACFVYP_36005, partial [Kitasatospora sp. NPDC058201]
STNALELFALGQDSRIYRAYWSPAEGWRYWFLTGDWQFAATAVAAVPSTPARTLDLFGVGTDGTMAHSYYHDGWNGWQVVPGGQVFATS